MSKVMLIGIFAVGSLLAASVCRAEYIAYSTVNGQEIPLPQDLTPVHTLNLVNLTWSNFAGSRTRMAVSKVDNTTTYASYNVGGDTEYDVGTATVPINGIEAMITDAMNRTNRFRMVERQAVGHILQEQDFGASGRVAQPSAAKTGNVLGAQFLLEAVITNYEAGVSNKKVGGGIGGLLGGRTGAILGGIGVSKSTAAFGMNIRLVDAATSEVVFTKQINREIKQSGLTFGAGGFGGGVALGGFAGSYTRTPIGQTVFAAINEAAYELIQAIGAQSAAGSVIKVEGRNVYLNLGVGAVQVGDRLTLKRPGSALIDPETGISLGSEDEEIGTVHVDQVKDKFSIGSVNASRKPVKAKDRVISQRAPQSLEFGVLVPELQKAPGKTKAKSTRR